MLRLKISEAIFSAQIVGTNGKSKMAFMISGNLMIDKRIINENREG